MKYKFYNYQCLKDLPIVFNKILSQICVGISIKKNTDIRTTLKIDERHFATSFFFIFRQELSL